MTSRKTNFQKIHPFASLSHIISPKLLKNAPSLEKFRIFKYFFKKFSKFYLKIEKVLNFLNDFSIQKLAFAKTSKNVKKFSTF